jgi:hypothetical protein
MTVRISSSSSALGTRVCAAPLTSIGKLEVPLEPQSPGSRCRDGGRSPGRALRALIRDFLDAAEAPALHQGGEDGGG